MSLYPYIDKGVILGPEVKLIGPRESFLIKQGTYINEAILAAGKYSKIKIGKQCAIGYRVSIKALTHDREKPYPSVLGDIKTLEKDIIIGDLCWIGDNVFIKEGVKIGNNVTIGANSVVTKSFSDNLVIAGVPAKVISNKSKN